MAEVSETGSRDQSYIARANDRDLHLMFLDGRQDN
jgi:hypothetical protein